MEGVLNRDQMVRMLKEGFDVEPLRSKYVEFYDILKTEGIEPYRVCCDFEEGLFLWNWNEVSKHRMLNELYLDKECVALLPIELQDLSPADYVLGHPNRNWAHDIWGSWANELRAEAMKQTLYEPQQQAFGEDSKCTNYSDERASFPIDNWNGRPSLPNNMISNESSPVMYLLNVGGANSRYSKLSVQTGIHWRWICFLDMINAIRSNINTGPCVPWISPCGYQILHNKWTRDTTWLDAQLAGHTIVSGVNEFHYWNPGPPSQFPLASLSESIDAYSAIIHEVEEYRKPYQPMWEKIEVSAQNMPLEIETMGFVTTYEDYMRFKNPRI